MEVRHVVLPIALICVLCWIARDVYTAFRLR
jgi:hypothetical protein